jgi:predicted SprT family Zn-dependent metalloprotease
MENVENYIKELEENILKIIKIKKLKYSIRYDLTSVKTLGLFKVTRKGKLRLIFNKDLIEKDFEKYKFVIVHEFSHLVTYLHFGRVSSHGKEWKQIMKLLGQKQPRATTALFSNELGDVKASCKCSEHLISKNRATRIKNGTKYLCRKCGKKIKLIKDD